MLVHESAKQLVSTVTTARADLLKLDEETVRHKPTADRWSIAEVAGHLVDSACNNHQRFIRAQESDLLEFPKYEQNAWAKHNSYHDRDWKELVELWYFYNLHLAHVMNAIPSEQLQTQCTITPYEPCTLGFLVTDYLDHLHHHLGKIRERLSA